MRLEDINKLDSNEICVLLMLVNDRKILPYYISPRLICSIKNEYLIQIIQSGSTKLNQYGIEVLNSIKFKLGISTVQVTKAPCDVLKNYTGYWLRRNRKKLTVSQSLS